MLNVSNDTVISFWSRNFARSIIREIKLFAFYIAEIDAKTCSAQSLDPVIFSLFTKYGVKVGMMVNFKI